MILLIQIKQKKKNSLRGEAFQSSLSSLSLLARGGYDYALILIHRFRRGASKSFGCCAPFPEFPSTSSWAAWSPSASC